MSLALKSPKRPLPTRAALTASLGALAAITACHSATAPGGPTGILGATTNDAGAVAADAGLCTGLFGNPNDLTGLTASECTPVCAYEASSFAPPVYDAGFIASLVTDFQLRTPFPPLAADPYDGGAPAADPPSTVCGVLLAPDAGTSPRLYDLVTYDSASAASQAGALVTHFGHCGVCSTLPNLAVYMRENDLSAPVRACSMKAANTDALVACLEGLGFDLPCSQAWAYDSNHTRAECLDTCLTGSTGYYNLPDGGLDPCIQCDEDKSGPVFKAVAGRTRRNSGLPNAICRPCSEVQPLVHSY